MAPEPAECAARFWRKKRALARRVVGVGGRFDSFVGGRGGTEELELWHVGRERGSTARWSCRTLLLDPFLLFQQVFERHGGAIGLCAAVAVRGSCAEG
jgi:hypothetical protein